MENKSAKSIFFRNNKIFFKLLGKCVFYQKLNEINQKMKSNYFRVITVQGYNLIENI